MGSAMAKIGERCGASAILPHTHEVGDSFGQRSKDYSWWIALFHFLRLASSHRGDGRRLLLNRCGRRLAGGSRRTRSSVC